MGWAAWVALAYGVLLAVSVPLGAGLCRVAAHSAAQDEQREVLLWGRPLPDRAQRAASRRRVLGAAR